MTTTYIPPEAGNWQQVNADMERLNAHIMFRRDIDKIHPPSLEALDGRWLEENAGDIPNREIKDPILQYAEDILSDLRQTGETHLAN